MFVGSENSIAERQLIDKCAALYGSVSGLVEQIFVKNLVISMSERETVSHTPDSIRRADAFKDPWPAIRFRTLSIYSSAVR